MDKPHFVIHSSMDEHLVPVLLFSSVPKTFAEGRQNRHNLFHHGGELRLG
jgi:hypothetical protein